AGKNIQIDELDYHLLNEIALNARIPLIEIAEKLQTSSQTVNYRMKNLTDKGIIQAFRVNINEMKLGFKRYKVDIFLKKHGHRSDIITYISKNPFVLYISASAGLSDLEVEMIVESPEQLISILEDVNMKFPNAIRNYSFYGDIAISKETFLPRLFD
ncbi:MAG: winged helix-turn-helix transcriptional regulator, partial [Candidatus Lokiarchaeota archaeon]